MLIHRTVPSRTSIVRISSTFVCLLIQNMYWAFFIFRSCARSWGLNRRQTQTHCLSWNTMGRQAFKQKLALKYVECFCRDYRVPWSIQQVDLTLSQESEKASMITEMWSYISWNLKDEWNQPSEGRNGKAWYRYTEKHVKPKSREDAEQHNFRNNPVYLEHKLAGSRVTQTTLKRVVVVRFRKALSHVEKLGVLTLE